MKKVFTDGLPREGGGRSKRINWRESVGLNMFFIYDDIEGYLTILGYNVDNRELVIESDGFGKFKIDTSSLLKCALGKFLSKVTNEFKYEIGSSFTNEKKDMVITNREYRGDKSGVRRKFYKYKCNKCGYSEGWIREQELNKGGCTCCSNKTPVLGINTIWDTDRWMCDLGVSEEDAKKYTRGSGKKITVECPDCGKETKRKISSILYYRSICCICGDGFSYPEKFMYSVLEQIGVNFIIQLSKTTFKWCEKYRYDFYIPSMKMIIEVHGGQHYSGVSNSKLTLDEIKNIDIVKEDLAKENGIKEYVVIDCRKSNSEYIRNNIINSKLKDSFDLECVNWDKSELYAIRSNKIKDVCDYWSNKQDWETTYTIAKNNPWGIKSNITIRKYIKQGAKLGWCHYDAREENFKGSQKAGISKSRKIEIFKDGKSMGIFNSSKELSEKSEMLFKARLIESGISLALNRKREYKGFNFKIIDKE